MRAFAGRTGGERHQSANHWPAVTRPGWDAQVVITCLPLPPFAADKHTAPGNQPRRGPQLFGGECARPKLLRHLTAPSSPRTDPGMIGEGRELPQDLRRGQAGWKHSCRRSTERRIRCRHCTPAPQPAGVGFQNFKISSSISHQASRAPRHEPRRRVGGDRHRSRMIGPSKHRILRRQSSRAFD